MPKLEVDEVLFLLDRWLSAEDIGVVRELVVKWKRVK